MDTLPPETQSDPEDEDEDLFPDIWVEKATSLLWECKFFETFVLVRPATPVFYLAIKRIGHKRFSEEFEEFCGDKKDVREFINSKQPDFIIDK